MCKYKIETHCHTAEVSACSRMPAAQLVNIYKTLGYSGVCVTDHFNDYFFDYTASAEQNIERYLAGYRAAKAEGDRIGVKVYLGAETRPVNTPNDHLLYGFDVGFLYKLLPIIKETDSIGLCEFARSNGVRIFQAHPFRPGLALTPPEYLDGIEAYNGHPGHNSHNELAIARANEFKLQKIGGSDAHEPHDCGTSGILSEFVPETTADYFKLIFSREYQIITEDGVISDV